MFRLYTFIYSYNIHNDINKISETMIAFDYSIAFIFGNLCTLWKILVSVCLSVCLYVCMSVCLSVCMSVSKNIKPQTFSSSGQMNALFNPLIRGLSVHLLGSVRRTYTHVHTLHYFANTHTHTNTHSFNPQTHTHTHTHSST